MTFVIDPGTFMAQREPAWLVDKINAEGNIKHIPLPDRDMWIVIMRPYALDPQYVNRMRFNRDTMTPGLLLHLCGYVGVLPASPLFGRSLYECICGREKDCQQYMHTLGSFLGIQHELNFEGRISQQARYHFFGFDCGHAGDYIPGRMYGTGDPTKYRDMEYVEHECRRLADQMALMESVLRGERPSPMCHTYLHAHDFQGFPHVKQNRQVNR